MLKGLATYLLNSNIIFTCLSVSIVIGMLNTPANGTEIFSLTLDSKPFSPYLCDKPHQGTSIKIKAAHHRDLKIHRIPGQFIPNDPAIARSKDYTYFITLKDLSNGVLTDAAIAFRNSRAVIFTQTTPAGISRQDFLKSLPTHEKPIALQALNTFLRLQPIIGAAIDTCRPYPPTVTYGTDDEIDRIETGRLKFQQMIKAYNENAKPQRPLFTHETGMSDGFFDPNVGRQAHVSYQALNPLSFYRPPGRTMANVHLNIDGPR